MKKIFSYEEAAALLAEVRELTTEAQEDLRALGVDAEASHIPAGLEPQVEAVVSGWAQTVVAKGVEVKGIWLVDFDNGSGYYCWRYPEAGLEYYHSYEDGFRGRLRIH